MIPWDRLPPEERDYFGRLGDGLVVVLPAQPAGRQALPHGGAWLHVDPGGAVRAFTGKVEVGQGTRTALALLVAEELRVPLAAVRIEQGDTDVAPWDIGTFGSLAMPTAAQHLRIVAARARELLARPGPRPARQLEIVRAPVALTPGEAWTTAGRATAAADAVEAVTGARRFVSDLRRPGMLHGRILHPPAPGATLREVDTRRAAAMAGVTVVHDDDLVAVAAADPEVAEAARAAIVARWELAPPLEEAALAEYLRAHPSEGEEWWGATLEERGDVDAALAGAAITVAATYTTAYLAHVALETRCALAEWDGARLTVTAGTQTPFMLREELAGALGLDEAEVRVVVPPTGGGFGGKHGGDVALAAARLARASGRPVRVAFSREEELTCTSYRPMAVIDVRAGAAADGTLLAWEHRNLNSGPAALATPYRCPSYRVAHQPAASPLPQGSYRALAATANCFARESHMDELALRAGVDPLAYRLRHLDDPRLAAVLEAAAARAGWGAAPRALGIACGVEKGGRVATVAALRDERVERVVTAFECGAIVNPDNLRNQIEGATVMGLGGALFEAVHVAGGRVTTDRLSRYRVPRFFDVPPIEVVLLDRRDLPPAGAGETPMIALAPAIANAVCATTGRRLRALPLFG